MNDYKIVSEKIIELLKNERDSLINILLEVETYQMAIDEIKRCYNLFTHIDKQEKDLSNKKNKTMCSYLPLNQPLYSLALNVIVPSLMLKRVFYRPPKQQMNLHTIIFNLFAKILNNIEICCVSRRDFHKIYVSTCDIINFTGKFENANLIVEEFQEKLIFYNGSAINPIVLSQDINLEKAVDDVFIARLYNTGQDCMAPAIIFVHEEIIDKFLMLSMEKITSLKIGDNRLNSTQIGSLLEVDSIEEFLEFKEKHFENLYFEGNVNYENKIMEPSLFYFQEIPNEAIQVYYAPYFVIAKYTFISEIIKYLELPYCKKYCGYISLYGNNLHQLSQYTEKNKYIMLRNQTLFTEEDGNGEFGGYGEGCSFIFYKNKKICQPILLSRDINKYLEE